MKKGEISMKKIDYIESVPSGTFTIVGMNLPIGSERIEIARRAHILISVKKLLLADLNEEQIHDFNASVGLQMILEEEMKKNAI